MRTDARLCSAVVAQPAAIEFEKLPSSGIYFLGAGEDRPFETCFCEVIVMSFCTDKGEGDSENARRILPEKRREVNAVSGACCVFV